jgi:hypothetical protein
VENELLFYQKHRSMKHRNFQKFVLIEKSEVLSEKEYQKSKTS